MTTSHNSHWLLCLDDFRVSNLMLNHSLFMSVTDTVQCFSHNKSLAAVLLILSNCIRASNATADDGLIFLEQPALCGIWDEISWISTSSWAGDIHHAEMRNLTKASLVKSFLNPSPSPHVHVHFLRIRSLNKIYFWEVMNHIMAKAWPNTIRFVILWLGLDLYV